MGGRGLRTLACAVAVFACGAGEARAQIAAPPWCGTSEPDAAGALPDGTQAGHPAGSFPHIPTYAIGCTLDRHRRGVERADEGRSRGPVGPGPAAAPGHDRRARDGGAADRLGQLQGDPGDAAERSGGFAGQAGGRRERRQGARAVPGLDPWQRVPGHRRGHRAARAARDDAARHGPGRGPDPRPHDRRGAREHQPGRARRGHARERRRVRHEPRLPDPVAAGDADLHARHARVERADLRRPARLLHARDARRADQAAQRGGRERPVPEVEPAAPGQDGGRVQRRGLPAPAADQRLVRFRLASARLGHLPGRHAARAGRRRRAWTTRRRTSRPSTARSPGSTPPRTRPARPTRAAGASAPSARARS